MIWLLVSCSWLEPAPPPRPALVERYQCYRCHNADLFAPASREEGCLTCHAELHAGKLDDEYKPEAIARWKKNVRHFVQTPNLTGSKRLRREWIASFLQEPHDVRPALEETMPSLGISPSEALELAELLVPNPSEEGEVTGDPAAGKKLFEEGTCRTCHSFEQPATAPHPLAPDLRHTAARMAPATLDAWLENPASFDPTTQMPRPDFTAKERRDVVAYLLTTKPLTPPTPAPFELLPPLQRPVSFEEAAAVSFEKLCQHCHSDPVPMEGEGGPGNTGGFGFAGVGLDLSSEAAVRRGDILKDGPSGVPVVVEALVARHKEVEGSRGVRRGMPLALPPLSAEEIQLVHTWALQARAD